MFVAHIPAGYLLSRYLSRGHPDRKALILTGVVASVLPDTDLLWFYLVDNRQRVHHSYVFHWPLFWVACAACAWAVARILHRPRLYPSSGSPWPACCCIWCWTVLRRKSSG
jgi:inner membrane protein